jgi:hypothetical protein
MPAWPSSAAAVATWPERWLRRQSVAWHDGDSYGSKDVRAVVLGSNLTKLPFPEATTTLVDDVATNAKLCVKRDFLHLSNDAPAPAPPLSQNLQIIIGRIYLSSS